MSSVASSEAREVFEYDEYDDDASSVGRKSVASSDLKRKYCAVVF